MSPFTEDWLRHQCKGFHEIMIGDFLPAKIGCFLPAQNGGSLPALTAKSDLIGEKERMTLPIWVNKYSDRPGRTLLAWRRLIVMHRFMPGGLMQLYVTIRQLYGV